MQALLDVILPVFLVIGFGYVAVWRGFFTGQGIDALMKFSQNFAIPCLLFSAIANLDLSTSLDIRMLGSFYAGATSGFVLGTAGAYFVFKRDIEDSIAIGFCCLFSNSVLLGLAINERAYGADALAGAYAIIAFHSPFCYGVGITVMEIVRNRGHGGMRMARSVLSAMFKNALILGIALGFVVNLSGLVIPRVVDEALGLVTRAALPAPCLRWGACWLSTNPRAI